MPDPAAPAPLEIDIDPGNAPGPEDTGESGGGLERQDGESDPYNGIPAERITEITRLACGRLRDCRTEMGLDFGGSSPLSPIAGENTWAWFRQIARIEYKGNYTHRKALGGVFDSNNWSLNVPRRFVRLLAAQHADDLVGTDPFFAAMPESISDRSKAALAKQVEKKVQAEVSRSNLQEILSESIRVALTEGERCVKLWWTVDETSFTGPARVMVDAEGAPVKTSHGRYVYENDDVLQIVVDQDGNFLRQFDGTLNAAAGEQRQGRLEADPSFIMPPSPQFQDFPALEQTLVNQRGLSSAGLFTEDFVYPITVPSLESPDCDIMAHVYDTPLEDLQARYKNAGYPQELEAKLQGCEPKSQAQQPITDAGEQTRVVGERKLINIHETYYRCRINPDDEKETWLFLVIDYVNQLCIYADFLGNMKMKRPPFVLLRGIESEPGRAYGVGVFKMFGDKNLAIDVWFNRLALKSSKEGSITCVHRDGFEETMDGHELVIGDKKFYHIPQDKADQYGKDHPPVFRINLNEVDEFAMEMLEKMIQSGQLEFGVISAADGSAENLNSSGTATGVKNIERTGNLLQRMTENMMARDMERIMELATDLVLENMQPEEVAWIDGENRLATLNREDIRNNLPRDVRLLMTKARSAESLDINQQIKATILEYYGLSLALRQKVRSTYVQILKNLYVEDADERLEEPTDDDVKAEQAAGAQSKQTKESASIALKDIGPLTPDERAQALQILGITASPAPAAAASASASPSAAASSPSATAAPSSSPIPGLNSAAQQQPLNAA